MKRYVLILDLKNDPDLIGEYEQFHQEIWPEIRKSILDSGILEMEIFRVENRLTMILEARDDFSFEKKAIMDKLNPKVKDWEDLMWKYQQALPFAEKDEKWILMKKIFELK